MTAMIDITGFELARRTEAAQRDAAKQAAAVTAQEKIEAAKADKPAAPCANKQIRGS